MKKKIFIYLSIMLMIFLSIIGVFSYAYFSASVNTNNSAIVNTTLPSGSFLFNVENSGIINFSLTSSDMLQSTVSNAPVASGIANLAVKLKSPDKSSRTVCYYDLVWEWTGTDQYTTSDVTLPYTTDGITYNYEMSVYGYREWEPFLENKFPDEMDLSNLEWTNSTNIIGNSAPIVKGLEIVSTNDSVFSVDSISIFSYIYNIPVPQPNLQNKNFQARVKVDNVNCNIFPVLSPKLINGTLDTNGSVVKIGNEEFYVIGSNSTSVKLFAKYNLHVGYVYNNGYIEDYPADIFQYNMQDEEALGFTSEGPFYGTINFSNSRYYSDSNGIIYSKYGTSPAYVLDNNSVLYSYLNEYKNKLITIYGLSNINVRAITQQELVGLGCDETNNVCTSAPSWVYSTSYWTGSAVSKYIRTVNTDGNFKKWQTYADKYTFGIRPVIEINRSSINV